MSIQFVDQIQPEERIPTTQRRSLTDIQKHCSGRIDQIIRQIIQLAQRNLLMGHHLKGEEREAKAPVMISVLFPQGLEPLTITHPRSWLEGLLPELGSFCHESFPPIHCLQPICPNACLNLSADQCPRGTHANFTDFLL